MADCFYLSGQVALSRGDVATAHSLAEESVVLSREKRGLCHLYRLYHLYRLCRLYRCLRSCIKRVIFGSWLPFPNWSRDYAPVKSRDVTLRPSVPALLPHQAVYTGAYQRV